MRCVLLTALLAPLLLANPAPPRYQSVSGWPASAAQAPAFGTDEIVGVAVGTDRVYVLQHTLPAVLVFGKDGRFIESWGDNVTLRHSCRIDPDGNVWLAGIYNHQVAKFSPDGQLLAIFGEYNKPGSDQKHFAGPADIAFSKDGSVYIADGYDNSRVVHLAHDGTWLGQWGTFGKKWGQFRVLHSIATDADGKVYVADRENRRIQVFTPDGQFLYGWGVGFMPYSIYPDKFGHMFVSSVKQIACYTLAGRHLSTITVPRGKELHMISVDDDGTLYSADLDNNRVLKFNKVK